MVAGPQYKLPDTDPGVPCTAFSVGIDDASKLLPVDSYLCLGDLIRIPGNT